MENQKNFGKTANFRGESEMLGEKSGTFKEI